MGVISAPTLLSPAHLLDKFDCGHESLNVWLKKKAGKTILQGGSARTYVVCNAKQYVLGYYALSSGSVIRGEAPRKVSRNMPDPIPVILIGRLAVDRSFAGQGIGAGLLKDALLRVDQAAGQIGIRAVLVHAIDEEARGFYLKHGYYDSPTNDMTLMITVKEIQRLPDALGGS